MKRKNSTTRDASSKMLFKWHERKVKLIVLVAQDLLLLAKFFYTKSLPDQDSEDSALMTYGKGNDHSYRD